MKIYKEIYDAEKEVEPGTITIKSFSQVREEM